MFKGLRADSFVCLDDISGHPESMNCVIYNPLKNDIAFRIELLHRIILKHFNVDLTSEQLIHLTRYDATELKDFVTDLKKIIEDNK